MKPEAEQQAIVEKYQSGRSVADIAFEHKCADHTVYRILRRCGIQRTQKRKPIREPRPSANAAPAARPASGPPIAPGLFPDKAAALARLMAGR